MYRYEMSKLSGFETWEIKIDISSAHHESKTDFLSSFGIGGLNGYVPTPEVMKKVAQLGIFKGAPKRKMQGHGWIIYLLDTMLIIGYVCYYAKKKRREKK